MDYKITVKEVFDTSWSDSALEPLVLEFRQFLNRWNECLDYDIGGAIIETRDGVTAVLAYAAFKPGVFEDEEAAVVTITWIGHILGGLIKLEWKEKSIYCSADPHLLDAILYAF